MMGVRSLEVDNTVNNNDEKNNKLQILFIYKQVDALELDTGVLPNMKKLYEIYDLENIEHYYEFIEKATNFSTTSFKKRRNLQKKILTIQSK